MEYTLRKPVAKDLFVATKIFKAIGIKNIANCFNSDELEDIKKLAKKENDKENNKENDEEAKIYYEKVGIMVATSLGDLILDKLEDVQEPLIKFMSNLSGLKVKEIEELSITDFAEMVISIVKMPDFVDFIKVVLKLSN